jgi:hypothetical protein
MTSASYNRIKSTLRFTGRKHRNALTMTCLSGSEGVYLDLKLS